jgi:hypothetical protein
LSVSAAAAFSASVASGSFRIARAQSPNPPGGDWSTTPPLLIGARRMGWPSPSSRTGRVGAGRGGSGRCEPECDSRCEPSAD